MGCMGTEWECTVARMKTKKRIRDFYKRVDDFRMPRLLAGAFMFYFLENFVLLASMPPIFPFSPEDRLPQPDCNTWSNKPNSSAISYFICWSAGNAWISARQVTFFFFMLFSPLRNICSLGVFFVHKFRLYFYLFERSYL